MKDFLIVGHGLSACVLANTLHSYQLSFDVVGLPGMSRSSLVAAGMWNPVVFKRMTKSWMAHETIPFLKKFYSTCESRTGKSFMTPRVIIKPFAEEQEKKLWLSKARFELDQFLEETTYTQAPDELRGCLVGNSYGTVHEAGNVNVKSFIDGTTSFFRDHFFQEEFHYNLLQAEHNKINYRNRVYSNVIFCEGYLIKNNPWFADIPMKPVKGEVLSIQAPELSLGKYILNKNSFLVQNAEGFSCGATYDWDDLTETPTEKGRIELEDKLWTMTDCNYSVSGHQAGIRPATIDRRPVIGRHGNLQNMFVFNGMGTKGVMLAPYLANNFVLFYLQRQALNKEADVSRFYKH